MKQIRRISYMVLLSLIAFAISSCTKDYDYSGAEKVDNEVYFSNPQASTFEISKDKNSFDISLRRVKTEGELTVPLTYTADEGSIFTVPASVTFADGQDEATIKVSYNPNDVQYGTYNGGTISIAGEGFNTTYGIGSFTFKAGATEWVDITTNKSMGAYREDLITTFFNVGNYTDEVKIQKSVVEEGKYRIVNPFASWKDEEGVEYDSENDHYWVINATDPDYVYMDVCKSGLNINNYGEITVCSQVAYNLAQGVSLEKIKELKPEWFGTLKDGIITMPVKSMLISMADYNDGAFYYANNNGMFAVALPGSTIADYSLDVEYKGRFTDPADNDYAQFTFTFGSDVASVKYALVSADADLSATTNGIIDGSVESEEISEPGDASVLYGESGKYTLVMVIYNEKGEYVDVQYLDISLKSSKDAAEQWNDIAAGTLTLGIKDYSVVFSSGPWGLLMKQTVTGEAVLSQSSADASKFRISPFLADEHPLEFTVNEDGTIDLQPQETGLNVQGTAILVADVVSYFGINSDNGSYFASNGIQSNYDSTKGLYTFYNFYHAASGGAFAFESDTFEVTTEGEAKAISKAFAKAKKAAANKSKKVSAKCHKVYVAKGGVRAM